MDDNIGIFSQVPFAEYAAIDALNYSTLKHMQRSPMSYKWHRDHKEPETPEMALGTATHKAVLEPHLAAGYFAVWEAKWGRRFGKNWDSFKAIADAEGKQVIRDDEAAAIMDMRASVQGCAAAKPYLTDAETEVVIVWRSKAGRLFKGRLDLLGKIGVKGGAVVPFIGDLKTTRDARPFKFGSQAYQLGYHIQAALYGDGYYTLTGKLPLNKIIAVEKNPPYECTVYNLPPDVVVQGHDDLAEILSALAECEKTNSWPSAPALETDLSLPSYAYPGQDDDLADLELDM